MHPPKFHHSPLSFLPPAHFHLHLLHHTHPLTTTDFLSLKSSLHFLEFYIKFYNMFTSLCYRLFPHTIIILSSSLITRINSSFLFITEQYSIVSLYHSLLMYSSLDGYWLVSRFWLSQIQFSCTFMHKFLYRHMLSIFLG